MSDARFIDARGRRIGRWRCPFGRTSRVVPPAGWFAPLLVQNFFAIGAPVVRRDLIVAVGGLDTTLRYAADWKLWLQLASRAPARYLAEATVEFRVHGGAQTLAIARHPGEFRRQLDAVLAGAIAAPPPGLTGLDRWMRLARFSVLVNQTLSARAVGKTEPMGPLARAAWRLGPRGVLAYLRYSRVLEHASARLRAGVVLPA